MQYFRSEKDALILTLDGETLTLHQPCLFLDKLRIMRDGEKCKDFLFMITFFLKKILSYRGTASCKMILKICIFSVFSIIIRISVTLNFHSYFINNMRKLHTREPPVIHRDLRIGFSYFNLLLFVIKREIVFSKYFDAS